MAKVIDLVNKRFGKLVVLKRLSIRGNRGQLKWECRCDCGNIHSVTGESLRGEKSKSCGCYKHVPSNKLIDREQALFQYLYSGIKKRHKKKSEDIVLSLESFIRLSENDCFYCGIVPFTIINDRVCWAKSKGLISDTTITINGIDRIDSNKGYCEDNVVACCKHCNTAKNTMSTDDFYKWIRRVYEFNFK